MPPGYVEPETRLLALVAFHGSGCGSPVLPVSLPVGATVILRKPADAPTAVHAQFDVVPADLVAEIVALRLPRVDNLLLDLRYRQGCERMTAHVPERTRATLKNADYARERPKSDAERTSYLARRFSAPVPRRA